MDKGFKLDKGTIVLNRKMTELDLFVKDFLSIIEKHSKYLIVSGFVSIASGRTRGTEDVDMLLPIMGKTSFSNLFKELISGGFWCLQGDTSDEVYSYIKDFHNIRFARANEVFPNMEVIPIDKMRKTKWFEFEHPQRMRVETFEFDVPQLEFEILYKESILKGEKDLADAKHLRTFFKAILKEEKFKEFKPIIELESR
ncbi:MAG: hypothetical protein AABX51_02630 [Nanoarchaeota archaeon]|mgnify:CR=1 FL=1